jgi:hypothetical protein
MAMIAPETAVATSYYSEVMTDTPNAYWRLGEATGSTAADAAGNSNTGTYYGGVTLGATGALGGSPNTASTADGVDDYISVTDSATLSPAAITVETWVKVNAYSGSFPRLVSKLGSHELIMYTYAGTQGRLEWKVTSGSPAVTVNTTTVYADRLLLGEWYHVAATFDGSNARIYINGAQKATAAATGALVDSNQPTYIAARSATDRHIAATLDEVAIYPAALAAGRIATHYAARDWSESPDTHCLGVEAYDEIRSGNTHWNNIAAEPLNPAYRGHIEGFGPYYDQVDGLGCLGGTTGQILEWAAIKWGIDDIPGAGPDLIKAVAVKESDWYARVQGDFEACDATWCFPSPGYYGTTFQTRGITGVKTTAWPDSWDAHISTAFAADYYGAALRAYYDGAIPWASGTEGDIVKAVAAWYCGCDTGYTAYTNDVFGFLAAKSWETQTFKTGTACSTNCAP